MTTQHDALDAVREADRRYVDWQSAQATAKRTNARADIDAALRAWEAYQTASQRADRAAATFALGTGRVAG